MHRLLVSLLGTAVAAAAAAQPPEEIPGDAAEETPAATADAPADAVLETEPVVVTASREPQPLPRSPGSVTVITREQIERSHHESVVDILRHVPGVHVDSAGPRGGRASVYTRGADPNQTLVLVDGVRMNDPTNARGGSFDLSTLDPAGIERIEVVRGPVSAVHGSDAIAGAIQIITRDGRAGRALRLDGSGGRYGVQRYAGEAREDFGLLDAAVAGAWVSEGDPNGNGDYTGGNAKAVLGLDLPGDAHLKASARFADAHEEAFPDDSGGPNLAVLRQREDRRVRETGVRVTLDQAPHAWLDYELSAAYYRHRETRESPGIAPGIRNPAGIPPEASRDVLNHYALALRNTAHVFEGLSLVAGGDVYWDDGSSNGELFPGEPFAIPTSFDLSRVVGGPFAELHFADEEHGLDLYAGLRVDFPDDDSTQWTPRVGGSVEIPVVGAKLRASWGEGFKLPSFYALGNPLVGNPDLDAERSHGWDVELSRGFWDGRIHAGVTYFRLEVKDLIDFDPVAFLLVNRSKVVSRGVEAQLAVRPFDGLELGGSLTFTDTDIRGTSDDLLDRPRWRGDVAIAWRPRDDLTLQVTALIVGKVKDSSVPTGRKDLEPYGRVDVAARWRIRDWLTLYVQVDNLFDEQYQEAIGFPANGIRPRAGVEVHL